ncbi:hypothetical protein [Bacteroides cellulosilyticus]|jgi:hypothetical protein|uniref:hypothetical protein n=1 Tax=Bacteroides cellulosilyticus TaxID=246787 RepID=UPI001D06895C|nr:hypothetical protein [Bacteroides cellulosilyticus]MCB6271714.1 hypothetical protein [Bacteroides cellulosilyticus]MCG4971795.1 hypothetical protein [Bacteroides cellulosilyticus]DAL31924.1 MAG TPA_asm: hypothetical protein [Caudoviricetes sp.]
MKSNVISAKGAEAKAAVLGNAVTNSKQEEAAPLLLLPPVPEEKKEKKPAKVVTPVVGEKKETATAAPKRLSIDELTDKADRVYLLRQKYQEVREKRKQLESFTISHDKNNAQLTLVDAKGLSISTSNPVAIGKLLADWMLDLNNHLSKTEKEIRVELEQLGDN